MEYGGKISISIENGTEIAAIIQTLTKFRARRVTAGSSGTTTIELEINGITTGDTLSWTSADPDWTLKSTNISVVVATGDRISFAITSAEGGSPRDIFAEVD
jgi:hypothetical protein